MEEPTSTEFSDVEEKANAPPPVPPPQSKFNENFYTRTRATIFMLLVAIIIFSAGHAYCALLVMVMNLLIFNEINSLKRNEEKEVNIPMTKYLNWYLFLAVNYYCFGSMVRRKFPGLGVHYEVIGFLLSYHDFISFCGMLIGFLCFVLSLKHGYLRYQFRLFGWIILATLIVSYQSWLIINNIFEGFIWFLVPSLLIVSNDIFAYIVGYFYGNTPLIALSPKKTWEGYVGGGIFTIFFSFMLTSTFQTIPGIVCPVHEITFIPFEFASCNSEYLEYLSWSWLPMSVTKLQAHMFILSLFASIIGPFGGFFASGLKRSIKIKDFANLIPGHGGVSDRMDCQIIMGSFTYFYLHSLVKIGTGFSVVYLMSMITPQ